MFNNHSPPSRNQYKMPTIQTHANNVNIELLAVPQLAKACSYPEDVV